MLLHLLACLGVELSRVRSAVEFTIGRGEGMVAREPGLGPRGKKVIELAVDEPRCLGHHYIGTEHLLLGVVREGSGPAAGILQTLGVTLEKVRTQTIQVLGEDVAGGEPPPQPKGSGMLGAVTQVGHSPVSVSMAVSARVATMPISLDVDVPDIPASSTPFLPAIYQALAGILTCYGLPTAQVA